MVLVSQEVEDEKLLSMASEINTEKPTHQQVELEYMEGIKHQMHSISGRLNTINHQLS